MKKIIDILCGVLVIGFVVFLFWHAIVEFKKEVNTPKENTTIITDTPKENIPVQDEDKKPEQGNDKEPEQSNTLQDINNATKIEIREKIITLNKEYDIYLDGNHAATVSGKYINVTGDVFKLEDLSGNVLASEKQIKRWGIKLNRLAKVMNKDEEVVGYIGEDVIEDFFSISKYKFHFYDENKNEYAYTREKKLSLLYEFEIYNNEDEQIYKIEKNFDLLTDSYYITKISDSDVTMDKVIFLTCIVDAIRDANE